MFHLSNQQLRATIAQLDQAIYNHEQWHRNVLRVLVARLPADTADLAPDAYRHCRFGQWYESDDVGPLREHPAFAALGEAHMQLHQSAAELLQRADTESGVSIDDYDRFNNRLDRIRLEIQSLRSELLETVQNRDPLTGARNRVGLLSDLREQQALVRRGVQQCGLIMIDLDHFKEVNDRHGHAAGDAVLRAVSRCLQSELRPYDHLYRYGGEEFLVVMPQISVEGAAEAAERFRAALDAPGILEGSEGEGLRVSASIGVAALDPERPVEESIDRADGAMYGAKAKGRNRVERADGSAFPGTVPREEPEGP